MSLQLLSTMYSDSDSEHEDDDIHTAQKPKEHENERKRKRSEMDEKDDIKPSQKKQRINDDNKSINNNSKKKKIKLSNINIEDKISSMTKSNIDFLNSHQDQNKDFMVEKLINNELNKISETNQRKKEDQEYKQRLRDIENEKLKKQQGLKRKLEHKKYLKQAEREHIDEFGEKVKVKQIGKGGHTKNQRISW